SFCRVLRYWRQLPMVFGVCMKYLKNEADSNDAVMDIFEVVCEDLFKYTVKHPRSWIYMVARNHCLARLGRNKTRQKHHQQYEETEREFMESAGTIHLTEVGERERQLTDLEACIEALKDQQRTCIRLFYLQEKCYRDIADKTGFALSKVKSYIQNGKRNLKLCLERKNERQMA
ncbi:MAG: sigma-70 family RNA polymerase sigma factor, partial [Bacteroidota bacterium]